MPAPETLPALQALASLVEVAEERFAEFVAAGDLDRAEREAAVVMGVVELLRQERG